MQAKAHSSNGHNPPPVQDNLLPHDEMIEVQTLGAILYNPAVMTMVRAILTPNDFFFLRNVWVFTAMCELHKRGEDIDFSTVENELTSIASREEIGGAYLIYLLNNTPTSLHAETYAKIVHRASIRRQMVDVASQIAQLANSGDYDINQIMARSTALLSEVNSKVTEKSLLTQEQVAKDYLATIEDRLENGTTNRLPTKLTLLDKKLGGGLKRGGLHIIGGPTGMGKSALMMTMALNAALEDKSVAVFSMEMDAEEITSRLVAMHSGVTTDKQDNGDMDDREYQKFIKAIGVITGLPIVYPENATTVSQIIATCEKLHMQGALDLVIVDYIQIVATDDIPKGDNRARELAFISAKLKQLARRLGIPVVAGSQLNEDGRTRESKAIEHDADVVALIQVDDGESSAGGKRDVNIFKHRNGPKGTVSLYFHEQRVCFSNLHNDILGGTP